MQNILKKIWWKKWFLTKSKNSCGWVKILLAVRLLCVGGGGWMRKALRHFLCYARKVSMCVSVCEVNSSAAIWVFPKASFKIKFKVLKIESYLNKIAKQQQQKTAMPSLPPPPMPMSTSSLSVISLC